MSVDTVKARLKLIGENITGINSAVAGRPRNTVDANLPALLILTGRAAYNYVGTDLESETRTYRLLLLLKPWQEGIDLEAEALAEPFFRRMQIAFATRPGLESVSNSDPLLGVQTVRMLEDSGVIEIILAGTPYVGIEFPIQVTELIDTTRGL